MKNRLIVLSVLSLALVGCDLQSQQEPLRYITILSTNDIHGGIEATTKNNKSLGGLAFLGGVADSIRQGVAKAHGKAGGVLLVDAGDQFQGTLISNYNEGALVYKAMNAIGYDAVVPGNHSYDFGPFGWLFDKVTPETTDKNPRGVIEALAKTAKFPLLSANTYFRASLVSERGEAVEVKNDGCIPAKDNSPAIAWERAQSPSFLTPYKIQTVAGVRVAMIGIDFPQTASTTTVENVTDLCFANEVESYKRVRQALDSKADLFVLMIHDGNTDKEKGASALTQTLLDWNPRAVDVVIAGHTHFVHDINVNGVHVVQSGSGGERFGRVDLVWDAKAKKVDTAKTTSAAGIRLFHESCDLPLAAAFCKAENGQVSYEGVPVVENAGVNQLVAAERERIAPLAKRRLGTATKSLFRDRILESPLANLLTDAFRVATKADVSFINTGGIRDDLAAGEITYEDLFRVLPFSNHGLVVAPLSWKQLKALLVRSIKTCGSYGALMQSGLRVEFSRDCAAVKGAVDEKATLLKVLTVEGETLFDSSTQTEIPESRSFQVATLDFLAAGGSGYVEFQGTPVVRDFGIIREVLADAMEKTQAQWPDQLDGRWKIVKP